MPAQNQSYRSVGEDFGQRLEQFMQTSGLGPRPLGRLLGVSPYRVREWRRGVAPSGQHLFLLLTLAEDLGFGWILRGCEGHRLGSPGREPAYGEVHGPGISGLRQ